MARINWILREAHDLQSPRSGKRVSRRAQRKWQRLQRGEHASGPRVKTRKRADLPALPSVNTNTVKVNQATFDRMHARAMDMRSRQESRIQEAHRAEMEKFSKPQKRKAKFRSSSNLARDSRASLRSERQAQNLAGLSDKISLIMNTDFGQDEILARKRKTAWLKDRRRKNHRGGRAVAGPEVDEGDHATEGQQHEEHAPQTIDQSRDCERAGGVDRCDTGEIAEEPAGVLVVPIDDVAGDELDAPPSDGGSPRSQDSHIDAPDTSDDEDIEPQFDYVAALEAVDQITLDLDQFAFPDDDIQAPHLSSATEVPPARDTIVEDMFVQKEPSARPQEPDLLSDIEKQLATPL